MSIINLYKKFLIINKLGWIKSMRKGYTGLGYTFEYLLGKKEDSLPLPDFGNIEIKTVRYNSRKKIHLFSIMPDGDSIFPTNILDKLGYPDKTYKNIKVFNMDFNTINYTPIGLYKMGKIIVDSKNEKINFIAIDYLGNNLNIKTSWSFKMLKERLFLKLKKIVIIESLSKEQNNSEYYYYKKMNYYILKDFDTFIKLIEEGTINIGIKISFHKDKENFGKIKTRGTVFSICLNDIEKLYNRIPLELFEYQLI